MQKILNPGVPMYCKYEQACQLTNRLVQETSIFGGFVVNVQSRQDGLGAPAIRLAGAGKM
ncbi:hypothetical protein F2P45_12860 [Massilia sp. CCM 8733]|uniref:Uncharacterized protein n=1 Tax=Massilia mucilaginosa TaxID=2609282 RepID=A0ABX0NSW5_9BURK|nr:hypothetical protein [Massilia mucilaginosa]NHZ89897.1 hypothetical protein [Massilia mucilaginosa]